MLTGLTTTLKTWCARATRSRLTVAFFLVVLANFASQTTLHSMILSDFVRSHALVKSIVDIAGVQRGFAMEQNDVLDICYGIPFVSGTTCHTVYDGSATSASTSTGIQCVEGLTWLENYLMNSKSEEIVYLASESWLFVMSLIALMDESIPHLIVVLAAQFLNTGWISYRIIRDISANRIYNKIVIYGTCRGFHALGRSWQRNKFYVALGFSFVVLLCMSSFVSKLIKLYSMEKLSSVGSPPVVNRMLKWRLWMRVFLQFTFFFSLASVTVWYNKRKTLGTASYDSTNVLYDAGFYIIAIITLPWLTLGTYSITKENRPLFLVYAILSLVLLVISGLWFGDALYRYEYWDWRTFSCVTTMADGLLIVTCVLSVICRLNFGKGLAHFLVVEQKLQASGFTYDTFSDSSKGPSIHSTSGRSELPSRLVLDRHESLNTWGRLSTLSSAETVVFATWLPTTDGSGKECKSLTRMGERPISTTISGKDMKLSRAQSISDDGDSSLDEFHRVVL